jgi:DNA-binding transcriptional LysR family regulator
MLLRFLSHYGNFAEYRCINASAMNWDNLRFLLAVAREGSFRAAARALGVNQSTLSRRIDRLETGMGVRLFDRLPSGLMLTAAGRRMADAAEQMEGAAADAGREVMGQDLRLHGTLRVTAADVTLTRFLMPFLARFAAAHPDIELELISGYEFLSLARRQADVAIRIAAKVPDGLVGYRLGRVAAAVYGSVDFIACHGGRVDADQVPWVGWDSDEVNRFSGMDRFPDAQIHYRANSALVEIAAVRAGLGIASLACYHNDADPMLRRVLPDPILEPKTDMWLLTHRDIRHTARVRSFMTFMRKAIAPYKDRIEGRRPITPDEAAGMAPLGAA